VGRLKSLKGNVVEGLQSIEWVVFLLEFYVCRRVFPKRVFLLLTQEPIYTIEFCSLATTKRRKNNKSTNNHCLYQNTTVVGMTIKDKRDNSQQGVQEKKKKITKIRKALLQHSSPLMYRTIHT